MLWNLDRSWFKFDFEFAKNSWFLSFSCEYKGSSELSLYYSIQRPIIGLSQWSSSLPLTLSTLPSISQHNQYQ
jgi:hypothetical protein